MVLGGDCSILLGSALAMHRLGEAVGGRIGLVFVDGHSDFRHPGNASYVGAAAGEDLALVTGRGQADLAAHRGPPAVLPRRRRGGARHPRRRTSTGWTCRRRASSTRPVPALRAEGAARTAQWARDQLADCAGFWVHVDVDVLDPAVMPAVDAPDPGGIAFAELELLLAGLVSTPHCLGVELTVFDPDYDPDGAVRRAELAAADPVAGRAAARPAVRRSRRPAAESRAADRRPEPRGRAPAGGRGRHPAADRPAVETAPDDPAPRGRVRGRTVLRTRHAAAGRRPTPRAPHARRAGSAEVARTGPDRPRLEVHGPCPAPARDARGRPSAPGRQSPEAGRREEAFGGERAPRPPSVLSPPFSTNTANAMSPCQPMNQAWVCAGSLSYSAVPVLPCTGPPGTSAQRRRRCPSVTTSRIIVRSGVDRRRP